MSDKGISEDDWRAEIARLAEEYPARKKHLWTDKEREIVLYGHGKTTAKALLTVLNNVNKAAGRPPRKLVAMESFIKRELSKQEKEDKMAEDKPRVIS